MNLESCLHMHFSLVHGGHWGMSLELIFFCINNRRVFDTSLLFWTILQCLCKAFRCLKHPLQTETDPDPPVAALSYNDGNDPNDQNDKKGSDYYLYKHWRISDQAKPMIRSPMAAMEAGPWVLAWVSAPRTIYQSGYDADNMRSAAWSMLIIFFWFT